MDNLKFDADTHTYTHGGRIVPGVTTVLNDVGISDFSMVRREDLDYSKERGTAVHYACELYDNKNLGECPELIQPYLDQWVAFCDAFKPEWETVESKIFCPKFFYAGTLDRVAIINGRRTLIDIKTGVNCKSHAIQTAAYANAYLTDKRIKMDRLCVYVYSDKFSVIEHKSPLDYDVFLAALAVYNYKRSKS